MHRKQVAIELHTLISNHTQNVTQYYHCYLSHRLKFLFVLDSLVHMYYYQKQPYALLRSLFTFLICSQLLAFSLNIKIKELIFLCLQDEELSSHHVLKCVGWPMWWEYFQVCLSFMSDLICPTRQSYYFVESKYSYLLLWTCISCILIFPVGQKMSISG